MDYCAGALYGEANGKNSKSRWALKFTVTSSDEITLKFRIPAWAQDNAIIDGVDITKDPSYNSEVGYYEIKGCFDNKEIGVVFDSHLIGVGLSDNPNITAIMDGPIVLAAIGESGKSYGLEGRELDEALSPFVEHTYEAYPWQQSSYRSYSGNTETLFIPLYEVTDDMYTIYVAK